MMNQRIVSFFVISLTLLVLLVAWSGLTDYRAWALPPRPTPTATPMPTAIPVPPSASIELLASPVRPEMWTIVQWQDAWGDWHNVEGWQGPFDKVEAGTGWKTWRVAEKDFATGPFRWVIYDSKDGVMIGASTPFYLPGGADQSVRTEISLLPLLPLSGADKADVRYTKAKPRSDFLEGCLARFVCQPKSIYNIRRR